jgi:hypothetical protein
MSGSIASGFEMNELAVDMKLSVVNSAQTAGCDPLCCRKLRPHPTCVETTLPRNKAGWGERQPSSQCEKMIGGSKRKSQAGFG